MARPVFTARPDALARVPLRPVQGDAESTDPLLEEAVMMASGSLRRASGPSAAQRLTLRAYAVRSRTRTTPHGVFAGVVPAVFASGTELRLGRNHRPVTSPDSQWLSALVRWILDGKEAPTVRVTTSNLAVRRGDRWEVERRGSAAVVDVRDTPVTAFVLEACRDGLPAIRATAEIERRWPHAQPGTGSRIVRELIGHGFLLHDLLPDDPRRDPLGHLLDRLPAASTLRPRLARLRDLLLDADRRQLGDPKRSAVLREALDVARDILPGDRLLRVDVLADATVTLPSSVADKAAEAADVLWRVGWGTDPLAEYHRRFLTRYGTGRAVALLDVLDPVIGLGPVEDSGPIGSGARDPRREAALGRLLAHAVSQDETEIVLDDATVDRLINRDEGTVPRNTEIYVRVLAREDGRYVLAVSGGTQDALSTGGRFMPLLDRRPNHVDRGVMDTELVVRPRLDALASVAVETGLAARRIPVGVAPRPGDLALADLAVFSDGRRFVVWSRTDGREVRPVLYSRVALSLLPPAARFLALAGHSGERPWHVWSWTGITAPFTPAVRYRDTWLAPARWTLPPHLTEAAATPDGWDAALGLWRTTIRPRPPDIVVTDDADRHLPLDLRRADDRELLRRYARKGLAAVTALPGDDGTAGAVLPGPDGDHLLELVVCLDRNAPAPDPVTVAPPLRRPGDGLHLPGGPWISLAIEALPGRHEQILRSLAQELGRLPRCWDRWFWLRYHDARHGEHLRIRFHAAHPDGLLRALSRWAGDLRGQRLISGFCVEPYEQEIERYGGATCMTAAERFFDADSRLALAVLSATRQQVERLAVAATAALAITDRFGDPAVLHVRLDRPSHRRANTLKAAVRAGRHRPLPPGWTAALDDYATALPGAAAVASDLIHMHCNRLVPGGEPIVRALAADLHAQHVTREDS